MGMVWWAGKGDKDSGGSSQVSAPTPPPSAQSYGETLQEYINSFPQLVDLQRQYGPQLSQLDYENAEQYAPQYAKLLQGIERDLYPQTAALQENLAGQAAQGMNEPLPNWAAQQYMSDFNAGIGMNANAPIGVSARTTGLMNLQKQWGDYYRDLALSTTGRLPLRQAGVPSTPQTSAGLPNALSYQASTYGTYAPAYANQQLLSNLMSGTSGSDLGGALGSLSGLMSAFGKGYGGV